ncbi:MAG: hypothetical protein ACX98W_05180 [bacterium]
MSSTSPRTIFRPSQPLLRKALPTALLLAMLLATATGCVTRTVREPLVRRHDLEIDLVREVKGLSQVRPRDYEHPAIVSAERMRHVLGAVEVETREKDGSIIRQPAFHPDVLDPLAEKLAEAFAEATPDSEIGVKVVRKEMRIGIFHTKHLTTFLAYMDDGYLYLLLSRVDWPIPKNREDEDLLEPIRGQSPMDFRVVSEEPLFYAGPQALEIAWQDPVFRKPFRVPGTTSGEKRRREVLFQSEVPKDELEAERTKDTDLGDLSPEQLRALADLEEDRRAGRITEADYQRAKRQLLRER